MVVSQMKTSRIDDTIDNICQRGCRYVNGLLADPDSQNDCEDLRELEGDERMQVLEELRTIMAVYQTTGSCEL